MNSRHSLLFLAVRFAILTSLLPGVLHSAPGDLDTSFDLQSNSTIRSAIVQTDGKILIGGTFKTLQPNGAANATARNYIARLNADGTLDMGFDPNANNSLYNIAVQADGKIIIVGDFTMLQPNGGSPVTRNHIARLNADGTLDASFDPNVNSYIYGVAVQADGKIIIVGDVTTLQPNGAASATARNYIARLNADGTLDASFDPNASSQVYTVAVQADGKILIGGAFTTLQPNGAASATARNHIARLNADGTLDSGFNPSAGGAVFNTTAQADGKIILGGSFSSLQPNGAASSTIRRYAARLNADGTLDMGFDPGVNISPLYSVALQADGKIIIGGSFTALQPNGAASATARNYIARLNADGTLDPNFDPNANRLVFGVTLQPDGKILIGGPFTSLRPNGAASSTVRTYVARLTNDSATQSLAVSSPDRVQWLRGGASPEVQQVTFELSTNGGSAWLPLGAGTRVTGGWECSGLNLSGSGQIRARARFSGGYCNGSGGVIEMVAAFTLTNSASDIYVEQPANVNLVDGSASIAFGEAALGTSGALKTFTIRNSGSADLTLGTIATDGANAGDFSVNTVGTSATVPPGGSTTFSVTFAPGGTASGARTAALHIASNVSGSKNPFDITLSGLGLSTAQDSDGDGLNDHAEYQLAALGFDWQTSQPALVSTYYATASAAGLYTAAQMQALNVNAPVISRDPQSGQFKLTISLKQSANLQSYNPLPLSAGQSSINAQGELEFLFNAPASAAFFRLEAR